MWILRDVEAFKKPTQHSPYRYFFRTVFLNRRAATQYRALASNIPAPRLNIKRIYRAAVSQKLRTTASGCTVLVVHKRCLEKWHMYELISLTFPVWSDFTGRIFTRLTSSRLCAWQRPVCRLPRGACEFFQWNIFNLLDHGMSLPTHSPWE
jgi:hypothetical protein